MVDLLEQLFDCMRDRLASKLTGVAWIMCTL